MPIKSCFVMRCACVCFVSNYVKQLLPGQVFPHHHHVKINFNLCGIIHNELTLNWRLHDACLLVCYLRASCVCQERTCAHSFVCFYSFSETQYFFFSSSTDTKYSVLTSPLRQSNVHLLLLLLLLLRCKKNYSAAAKTTFPNQRRLQFLNDHNDSDGKNVATCFIVKLSSSVPVE